MTTIKAKFKFGNMVFVFEYDEMEVFVEGTTKQAKKALECDHFNDAIYEYVKKNIIPSIVK